MKIALVHDHLTQDGGGERVLKVFQEVFPEAPTFVLVHVPERADPFFLKKDIRTSFLQKIPFGAKRHQWLLPIMPAAVESYDLSEFDVVLSSTSMFAKGIITQPKTLHICYCHTPTRFLWSYTNEYVKELKYPWIVKKALPLILNHLRIWDRMSADRVDHFLTNSHTVKQRIDKYYQKESQVIYPPVDTHLYDVSEEKGEYFVAGGRIVSYKRFDIIVKAFSRIGIPLKIFGNGPDLENLKRQAGPSIEFLGRISEEDKVDLYKKALAYIHPQEEDFGISAVEPMAAGCPVIAYAKGGALETVKEGLSGEFFYHQNWGEIAEAVVRFDTEKYNSYRIKEHASQFSVERFKGELKAYIEEKWEEFDRK